MLTLENGVKVDLFSMGHFTSVAPHSMVLVKITRARSPSRRFLFLTLLYSHTRGLQGRIRIKIPVKKYFEPLICNLRRSSFRDGRGEDNVRGRYCGEGSR